MKSIMEEGSSILKAVEKAWIRAGKPQEFSVKIFEEEQKNFFGMTKRSAKVAIFFDEKKTTPAAEPKKELVRREMRSQNPREMREARDQQSSNSSRRPREREHDREYDRDRMDQEPRERRAPQPPRAPRPQERAPERNERKEDIAPPAARAPRVEQAPVARVQVQEQAPKIEREQRVQEVQETRPVDRPVEMQAPQPAPKQVFPKEVVEFAHNWLESVLRETGYAEPFELTTTDNTLHFILKKQVTQSEDREQTLFRSCSYLMMAALRNAFEHDFRNTKIIISNN